MQWPQQHKEHNHKEAANGCKQNMIVNSGEKEAQRV